MVRHHQLYPPTLTPYTDDPGTTHYRAIRLISDESGTCVLLDLVFDLDLVAVGVKSEDKHLDILEGGRHES